MNARARNRGDVYHRALGSHEFVEQTPRQHDGAEEIDLENQLPVFLRGFNRIEPAAAGLLRADRGIVHQCMKLGPLSLQLLFHQGDGCMGINRGREIKNDVIVGTRIPRAIFGKGLARTGNDTPARRREAFHRGMPDAARGAGEDERFPL